MKTNCLCLRWKASFSLFSGSLKRAARPGVVSLVVFAVLTVSSLSAATNDLTSLLQRGLFEEEANRNPAAAIASYQSLAAQFDKDREIAATAIFRLGECYRKLGRTNDAIGQYQRIIKEFSDQTTLATLSRQNLAGLGEATSRSTAETNEGALATLETRIQLLQLQLEQGKALRGGPSGFTWDGMYRYIAMWFPGC